MALQVVVVGGGIMGCMTAIALHDKGYAVTVIERNQIAAQTSGESSWAGAGIIFPLLPWFYQEAVNTLALAGAQLYPDLCRQLKSDTGIDPEYLPQGMLIKAPFDHTLALNWCRQHSVPATILEASLWLPTVAQVKPPPLLRALKKNLLQRGVNLVEHTPLLPLNEEDLEKTGHVHAWQSCAGATFKADAFVVTSGAWSYELLKQTTLQLAIKPMRGQILLYQLPVNTLPHILYQDGFYLLQRQDGYLLAGSTLEDVGFDARVTEAMKFTMQAKAEAILPALKDAAIIKHWSGLRPGTPHNIPTIAVHPTIHNLYLNTGHFRYGLTMAPESAKRLSALI